MFSNPFHPDMSANGLSSLREVHLYGAAPWLKGRPLERMVVMGDEMDQGIDQLAAWADQMLCQRLELPATDRTINVRLLLAMPKLTSLSIRPLYICWSGVKHIVFNGSSEEYQVLLRRVGMDIKGPAQLEMSSAAYALDGYDLRRNGHASICICPACS